ncbi:MAG TPA: head GIN domain-containing protein [Pedobacter sp.]|nr:head GIN domain-containing protein [Pedobacter sp.]
MNTINRKYFLTTLICGSALLGCKKETIDANGGQVTETRSPGHFTHVHTSGTSPVFITYGSEYKVELRGSENLIAKFRTTVSGDELAVGYQYLQPGKDDIRVYVTLPKLRKVSLSGSATMELDGSFPYLPSFAADISGSGKIKLKGDMEAGETRINLSGSGNALLDNFRSENAELNISGTGDIRTGITEKLKAIISGSGSIYYSGNPILETSISGTGQVIKKAFR